MRPTIYLAGPIRMADDPTGWRATVRQSTSEFDFIDPTTRDVDADSPAGEVVEGDLELINDANGLFVGWHDDVPSCGTPMEVIHAARHDIPVVIWRRDAGERTLSPWLRYHADVIREQRDAALWQLHGRVSGGVEA